MAAFDTFVVFAEMRTGSNLLEANLNLYPDLACLGEVFNPVFLAYPGTDTLLGFDQAARDRDPLALLAAIKAEPGVQGFRYFHDHHAGVLDALLADRRCAKVVLTRNPAESYVSWKIAQATGQWKLTNATNQKAAKARFDAGEFETHLAALQAFQLRILKALQTTGQTAFYLAYEDIQDLDVMNGLAGYLGSGTVLDGLSKKLKKQNPAPLSEKVENFAEMEAALAGHDRFDLARTPNFEPRRGPAIPGWVAAGDAPLLYMPIQAGPGAAIRDWLSRLGAGGLREGFTQKTLRQWKRRNKPHRSFAVVRHPVVRAYAAFEDHVLATGRGSYPAIREKLMRVYQVPLPPEGPGAEWTTEAQRAAFEGYLAFVKMNLGGQTAVRVDGAWATQAQTLLGFAEVMAPDVVLREPTIARELAMLCEMVGEEAVPEVTVPDAGRVIPLAAIYDDALEERVRDVYQRDYMTFGFGPWRA
ncbi:MAG: sulfotransferase family 2 domain-containing protein [Pseudomonadota bacterium]